MKRTAATLALLAGFGGGCMSPNGGKKEPVGGFGTVHTGEQLKQYQGPNGEPIIAARGVSPSGIVQASGTENGGSSAMFRPAGSEGAGSTCAHGPGVSGTAT